ncbi:MAG TPA: glycosyltransferase family 2 protein [Legionellaceae bacterium]|nr:glycosyltransferase family 2 protein [Legionellaceae bacterium]
MSLKLTISIPTWNRAEFLKPNVLSIIAAIEKAATDQVEVFISDNASTDDSAEFLRDISQQYPFIRYICQSHNQGANANFYTVLKEARGTYIWLLGDDDQIHEDCIQRILTDIDQYQPGIMIGGTEYDKTGERIYLPDITEYLLTDQRILLDYDGFVLAGKMSVLIYEKAALEQVLEQGWALIQALNTPWPHLIWLFQILARGHKILILPYTTNYIVENNRYNLLQCGVVRIDLMFIEYTVMAKALLSEFSPTIQAGILRRLVDGREGELAKILAYATFLNTYTETLHSAWAALKVLPLVRNRITFTLYYFLPALLPRWLRHGFFIAIGKFCPKWEAYHDFIAYLKKVKLIKQSANERSVFNKAYLK